MQRPAVANRSAELPPQLWSAGVIALTLLAAAFRLWRIGSWPFYGDEATTVVASTDSFSWGDLRPLAFAFNHYIAVPLFGPTEFAFRLAPLLAGIAVVPLGALAMRRYYGERAGLLTGLVLAVSPALLFHSQFGRYYMQALFFSGALLYSLRRWSDTYRVAWLLAAILWFLLGWFTVQSTSFVLPGFALWAFCFPRASGLADLLAWVRRNPIVAVVLVVAALGMVGALYSRMQHASNDRLLTDTRYFSAAQLILAFVSSLTLPIALAMAVAPFLALKDETLETADRLFLPVTAMGTLFTFAAAFPFLAVGPPHILSAGAALFGLAGYTLARIWRDSSPHWAGLADLLAWVRRNPIVAAVLVVAVLGTAWVLYSRMQQASNDRLLTDIRYFSAAQLILAFVSSLTLPIALAMAVAPLLALKDETLETADRLFLPITAIGTLFTFVAAFPFLAVGPPHILSAGAALFGLAGYTLARIWRDSSPHWAGFAVALIVVASTAREIASHFIDGSRTDFRPAIAFVRSHRASEAEPVFATQHLVTELYAPELGAQELMPMPDSLAWLRDTARAVPAWLIVAEHRRGPDIPEGLFGVHERTPLCRQVFRHAPARLDYPVNAVRVYQCPPLHNLAQ